MPPSGCGETRCVSSTGIVGGWDTGVVGGWVIGLGLVAANRNILCARWIQCDSREPLRVPRRRDLNGHTHIRKMGSPQQPKPPSSSIRTCKAAREPVGAGVRSAHVADWAQAAGASGCLLDSDCSQIHWWAVAVRVIMLDYSPRTAHIKPDYRQHSCA